MTDTIDASSVDTSTQNPEPAPAAPAPAAPAAPEGHDPQAVLQDMVNLMRENPGMGVGEFIDWVNSGGEKPAVEDTARNEILEMFEEGPNRDAMGKVYDTLLKKAEMVAEEKYRPALKQLGNIKQTNEMSQGIARGGVHPTEPGLTDLKKELQRSDRRFQILVKGDPEEAGAYLAEEFKRRFGVTPADVARGASLMDRGSRGRAGGGLEKVTLPQNASMSDIFTHVKAGREVEFKQ